jgi:hypothetical protein
LTFINARAKHSSNIKKSGEEAFMSAGSNTDQYPNFKSVFSAMYDWVRNRTLARQFAQRFDECDSNEVGRIARDLGLSRDELSHMARLGPDAANLLLKRLDALHLDAKALTRDEPGVMRDLQRLCSMCASKKQCQKDLEFDGENPVWRDYCPNEDTLVALRRCVAVGD